MLPLTAALRRSAGECCLELVVRSTQVPSRAPIGVTSVQAMPSTGFASYVDGAVVTVASRKCVRARASTELKSTRELVGHETDQSAQRYVALLLDMHEGSDRRLCSQIAKAGTAKSEKYTATAIPFEFHWRGRAIPHHRRRSFLVTAHAYKVACGSTRRTRPRRR